mgnify:CR=1 FL=1
MKNRVITISREFGSGGRTIGKKVAEELGIPCYDAEIIQEMAKETGFAPDYVKEAGEYAPGGFLSNAFSNRMFGPFAARSVMTLYCRSHMKWGHAQNYHLTLDSGVIGINKCVNIIAELY